MASGRPIAQCACIIINAVLLSIEYEKNLSLTMEERCITRKQEQMAIRPSGY